MRKNLKFSEEKRALYNQRRKELINRLEETKVHYKLVARYSGCTFDTILGYIEGRIIIQKQTTMDKLMKAIDYCVKNEIGSTKEKLLIPTYVTKMLTEHGNAFLNKQYKKDLIKIKTHLKGIGFDCRAVIVEEGHLILEDTKVFHNQFAQGKER